MKELIKFDEIEKIIGYKFKNKKYLQTAFIHSSYSNEHRIESNEKLEFLGDAIIEFIVTEILYLQFKGKEGDMSKIRSMIVSEKPLAEAVDKLGLAKHLVKGVGESKNKSESKAVKCDLFEAICGAIYLDSGIDSVRKFFELAVGDIILNLKVNGYVDDPKTKLQEILKQAKIVYSTTKTGEDHKPTYKTVVFVNGVKMGMGTGSNKKTAEEGAASVAINNLKKV
ncbi:MAG: ribonuclease III [Clostridia bacterium]|nr:ribonuclease III [Clostridia bacterium]